MNLKKLIVTLAVAACVASSFAQGFGGRRMGMMGGGAQSPAFLLQRDEVQEELKLTDDQKSKLGTIRDGMRDKMMAAFAEIGGGGGGRPDPTKMQEVMGKVQADLQKEIDAVLTPEQSKRLKEIAISTSGNRAALMPDVAKELALTDDQKAKIKDLQTKQGEASQALFEKMRNGELERDQLREKMTANSKIFDEELGKLLTEDQKKKLKDMGGKPFTLKEDTSR